VDFSQIFSAPAAKYLSLVAVFRLAGVTVYNDQSVIWSGSVCHVYISLHSLALIHERFECRSAKVENLVLWRFFTLQGQQYGTMKAKFGCLWFLVVLGIYLTVVIHTV